MIVLGLLLQILACLNNPPAPFLVEGIYDHGKWLSDPTWNALQTLTGRDLWIGYDNGGWETTGDEYRRYTLRGDDYEVWVYYSPLREEYELFPFADTALFPDANGDHWGMHPCGGWAVDQQIINAIIESEG